MLEHKSRAAIPSHTIIDFLAAKSRRDATNLGQGGVDARALSDGLEVAHPPAVVAACHRTPRPVTLADHLGPFAPFDGTAGQRPLLVKAPMTGPTGKFSMAYSIVLPNGDVHRFFALADGVHHAFTRRHRGRFDDARESELARPDALVVS